VVVLWLGCRCLPSVNIICGRIIVGLSLSSSASKHNIIMFTDGRQRQPNHNTTTYYVYWRKTPPPNQKTTTFFIYLVLLYFECTWWKLFQKHVVHFCVVFCLTQPWLEPIICRTTDGFKIFFSDNTRISIFFFCRAKRKFFFQNKGEAKLISQQTNKISQQSENSDGF
jgi:hypothetical protein